MGYHEAKFKAANDLWAATGMTGKGPLMNRDGDLIAYRGLSDGEAVIYGICAAITDPNRSMPSLGDIAHHLNDKHKKAVMLALAEVLMS